MNTRNGLAAIDSAVFYISKLHGVKDMKLEDRKFTVKWLQQNLKGIDLDELINAAQMALDGIIEINSQVYGIVSPKYLSELIYKYKAWKKESERQKMLKAPALPAPKTPQEEKDKIIREELYSVFNQFANTKELPFCASNVLFDYCWKNGMTRFSKIVVDDIKKRALEILSNEQNIEKERAKDVYELRQIANKYKQIDEKAIYKNKCKEIYLVEYFKDLVGMEEDIKNFIK